MPQTSASLLRNPALVLKELTTRPPVRLDDLPQEHGMYALHDHTGAIRYIGITAGDGHGFRGRINNRHVTGSESRSHKFAHAYNTGRMWRDKRDDSPDARLAKSLRTAFARRHCRASVVIVPPPFQDDLPALERAVQALAPAEMLAWVGARGFAPLPEPKELVDILLDDLRFSSDQRRAVERQAARQGEQTDDAKLPEVNATVPHIPSEPDRNDEYRFGYL